MDEREKDMSFFWMEESNGQLSFPMKRKGTFRSKKLRFIGWGSEPLIGFLESIGKDTSKQLSQYDVTAFINEYVHENKLLHPEKKKRILCDERLHALFGKKSVPRNKIYELLDAHFAENHDESEDELLYSSEENDGDVMMAYKEHKAANSDRKTPQQRKKVIEAPKSCFAAINSENVKLVYLKRTLIQDLLKDPETFEGKVVGSYVRVKSDPNDYFQKNSHQLLQVTGVKKASGSHDVGAEALLQVSNSVKDIPICRLSDDNFSEEECEDLRQKVKAGLIKRPMVVEFEEKAGILHEDITKHWLVRELSLLQNLIDRANEKGWRRELFEYLERKQLLQTPAEQSRLLLEVPKVIADEVEPEATQQDFLEDMKQGSSHSPKSILRGASDVSSSDFEANQTLSAHNSGGTDASGCEEAIFSSQDVLVDSSVDARENRNFVQGMAYAQVQDGIKAIHETSQQDKKTGEPADELPKKPSDMTRDSGDGQMQLENLGERRPQRMADRPVGATQVIELSDDDEEAEDHGRHNQTVVDVHPASLVWHYADPQGEIQGPFTLLALKRWSDADYFEPGFKVWRTGQSQDNAVLLTEVLRQMLPH